MILKKGHCTNAVSFLHGWNIYKIIGLKTLYYNFSNNGNLYHMFNNCNKLCNKNTYMYLNQK